MKKPLGLLIIIMSLSLYGDKIDEKILTQAYSLHKKIQEFLLLDKKVLFDKTGKDEDKITILDTFVVDNINKNEKILKEQLDTYIKKKGYVSLNKLLINTDSDIRELIDSVHKNNFNILNYVKGTYYYNYKTIMGMSNLYTDYVSTEKTDKGINENINSTDSFSKRKKDIICKKFIKNNKIIEYTFYRNNEPFAQHIVKDGETIKIKGDVVTGVVDIYDDDKFISRVDYLDNKKNGVETIFNDEGNISIEVDWKDNLMHGMLKKYHDNGKPSSLYTMTNGKRNGVVKLFYPSGALDTEAFYVNDKLEGILKSYYENGVLMTESTYKKDELVGISKQYTNNGKLKILREFDDKGGYVGKYYFLGEVKFWEKFDGTDSVIYDSETKLFWQKNHHKNPMNENPSSFCERLKYGGYNDWRLPTIKELSTLITESTENKLPGLLNMGYLTSSKYDLVDFSDNEVKEIPENGIYTTINRDSLKYICVRKN